MRKVRKPCHKVGVPTTTFCRQWEKGHGMIRPLDAVLAFFPAQDVNILKPHHKPLSKVAVIRAPGIARFGTVALSAVLSRIGTPLAQMRVFGPRASRPLWDCHCYLQQHE